MPQKRPSLLCALLWTGLGVLFLLSNLNIAPDILTLLRLYWPLLLIILGAGQVIRYFLRTDALAIRFGELIGIVLLLVAGIFITKILDGRASQFFRELPRVIGDISIHPKLWIADPHTFTSETTYALDGGAAIRIENSHGKISVVPGNDQEVRVRLKTVVYAPESLASDIAGEIRILEKYDSPEPALPDAGPQEVSNSRFVIKTNRDSLSDRNYRIDTDMEVSVPKNSNLQVLNSFGVVRVVGIHGELDLINSHNNLEVQDCEGKFDISSRYGECRLFNLTGDVNLESRGRVHLENLKGNVSLANEFSSTLISKVDGKVTASTRNGDLSIDAISQPVSVRTQGTRVKVMRLESSLDINASHKNVHVEDIGSDVSLKSRYATVFLKNIRGDVEIQSNNDHINADAVDGGFAMQGRGSRIQVNDIGGALNVRTTLKDVFVNDVSGSCHIENEYADISLFMRSLDKNEIRVTNRNGGISLHLPQREGFFMNAVARQGKVEAFYPGLKPPVRTGDVWTLESDGHPGDARISLKTEYGNIRVFGAPRRP